MCVHPCEHLWASTCVYIFCFIEFISGYTQMSCVCYMKPFFVQKIIWIRRWIFFFTCVAKTFIQTRLQIINKMKWSVCTLPISNCDNNNNIQLGNGKWTHIAYTHRAHTHVYFASLSFSFLLWQHDSFAFCIRIVYAHLSHVVFVFILHLTWFFLLIINPIQWRRRQKK